MALEAYDVDWTGTEGGTVSSEGDAPENPVKMNGVQGKFHDLHEDPDFLALSGHLDSDVIEDVALGVDTVGDLRGRFSQRMGLNVFPDFVGVDDATGPVNDVSDKADRWLAENDVDGREPTVELGGSKILPGALKLLVAMGQQNMGISRNGRVGSSKGGQKKKSVGGDNVDGIAATM